MAKQMGRWPVSAFQTANHGFSSADMFPRMFPYKGEINRPALSAYVTLGLEPTSCQAARPI